MNGINALSAFPLRLHTFDIKHIEGQAREIRGLRKAGGRAAGLLRYGSATRPALCAHLPRVREGNRDAGCFLFSLLFFSFLFFADHTG